MKRLALIFVITVACTACASTPLGFVGGTNWTLPLVGPLEDAELVVPFTVEEKGPYLFLLDPNARASAIDQRVGAELGLYHRKKMGLLTEQDHVVELPVFEVLAMAGGDLKIRHIAVLGTKPGVYRAGRRAVHGVLGRDLLSRSILIDVDRDAGVVRLALAGHATPPEGAVKVAGHLHHGLLYAPILIAGRTYEVVVDLAARTSALWPEILAKLNLTVRPAQERIVDDTGTARTVVGRASAEVVDIGKEPGLTARDVGFVPFDDRRWDDEDLDGLLGLNLLSRWRVLVDRDQGRLWLAPRATDRAAGAAARLARWGDTFASCAAPGCAVAEVVAGPRLVARRDPAAPPGAYEVVVDAGGRLFRATLPPGVAEVSAPVRGAPEGAACVVVDASPYPAPCTGGVCITALE